MLENNGYILYGDVYIPYEIMKNDDLNLSDKVVLATIRAHTRIRGACELTNKEIAEELCLNRNTVILSVNKLEKLDLIDREIYNHRFRELKYKKQR